VRLSTWLRGLDHTSPREAVTNYTKDGVCAPERPRRPTDRLRSERLRNSRSRRPISRSIPIARVIGLDKSQRNRTCEFRADTGSALRMGCGSPGNRVDRVTVASECERHEHRDRPVGRYCLFHFQTPSQVLWADGPPPDSCILRVCPYPIKVPAHKALLQSCQQRMTRQRCVCWLLSDSCRFHPVTAEIKLYKLLATSPPRNCQIRK
jgi:hypothetical protein